MNLFKSLMFLHGHFTRPEDLVEDAPIARREYGARTAAGDFARPLGNRALRRRYARLLQDFVYLGGRPMTAGHNTDIDEPFPDAAAAAAAPAPVRLERAPCTTRRGALAAVCGAVALSPFR